jgi:ABC-type polysaccharide/polyol phosphate transport system ATPase subunit
VEVIRATDLGIRFNMGRRGRTSARSFVIGGFRRQRDDSGEFWALRHVSFSVNEGDVVGVIGKNGSGKSTLLRVIGGIYPPDEGEVEVRGSVSTQFSLGAGFQSELSGVENIYLNGILMGLSKKEVDELLDDIIRFADIGQFIDMPVKTYSTGMQARLGFAVAIHVHKDVVLIDEIMGVGDAEFRTKCDERLTRLVGERTIVLVSHSMEYIRKFSSTVIWLDKGQIVAQGEPEDVIGRYLGP